MFTHDRLAVFGIGEADADGLVDEEDVGMLIPAIRIERRVLWGRHPAGAWHRKSTVQRPTMTRQSIDQA